MRNFLSAVLALVMLVPGVSWAQQAEQPQYEADKHYKVLPYPVRTQDPSKIEVVELFWYGCPHCRDFEPYVEAWRKQLPEDVRFEHLPAVFGKTWEVHAKAYFAADAMGIEDKIRQPLFDAIAKERKPLNDVESLASFIGGLGFDKEAFKKSFNSFGVRSKIEQALSRARGYRATGVPAVVVNGKYLVDATSAGGMDKVLRVVNFLIEKERAAKGS